MVTVASRSQMRVVLSAIQKYSKLICPQVKSLSALPNTVFTDETPIDTNSLRLLIQLYLGDAAPTPIHGLSPESPGKFAQCAVGTPPRPTVVCDVRHRTAMRLGHESEADEATRATRAGRAVVMGSAAAGPWYAVSSARRVSRELASPRSRVI